MDVGPFQPDAAGVGFPVHDATGCGCSDLFRSRDGFSSSYGDYCLKPSSAGMMTSLLSCSPR